jgi:hypothetical protein
MKPTPPLRSKLDIDGDMVFTVLHAPSGFASILGDLGDAVWQRSLFAPLDLVLTFHERADALASEWPQLTEAALPDGVVWVAFPSSPAPGRLDAAAVRASAPLGWSTDKTCSIDAQWSALRFRHQAPRLRPKDAARSRRG